MKIQIIPVETFDNLTSIKDKIILSKAQLIILNDLENSAVFNEKKQVRLFNRFLYNTRKEVKVVSKNPIAIVCLEDAGISALPDLATAQEFKWEISDGKHRVEKLRKKERSKLKKNEETIKLSPNWLRYLSFGFGVASVFVLISIFVPSAQINIQIPINDQSIEIPIVMNNKTSEEYLNKLLLEPVTMEFESFNSIDVSGEAYFPDTLAKGEIEISNLTDDELFIPAGLILMSSMDSSKQYKLNSNGRLEPGVGSSIIMPIEAVSSGEKGNSNIGEVTIVTGPLGLRISATNNSAILGGGDIIKTYPSAKDRNELRSLCMKDIKKLALQNQNTDVNYIFLPSTVEVSQILSEDFYPSVDQPTDTLSLELIAEITIQKVSTDILASYAKPYLDALLPRDHSPVGKIRVIGLEIQNINPDGSVSGMLNVTRPYKQDLNMEAIKVEAAAQQKTDFATALKKQNRLSEVCSNRNKSSLA